MGKHQSSSRLLGQLARALVLIAALGLVAGAAWYVSKNNANGADGAQCPTTLRVVSASSFSSPLAAAARTLRSGNNCVLVDITNSDGRAAAGVVSQVQADAWIPDDEAWSTIAPPKSLAERGIDGAYTTLATSPIYMVTDVPTAAKIKTAGNSWLGLSKLLSTPGSDVRLVVRNPGLSGDGMVAAGAVGEAVWLSRGMDASSLALANLQPVTRTVSHDLAATPTKAGEVGLVPEYALLPTLRLGLTDRAYVTGSDHTALLRYTWLPTMVALANPARAAALRRLLAAFRTPAATTALNASGLRGPDNKRPEITGNASLPDPTAKPFDVMQAHHVQHIFAAWDPEDRRGNLLVIVDIATGTATTSPSASAPAGSGRQQPLEVLRQGCRELANLMPVGSRLGLWEVGVGAPAAYRKVLPTDRLDDTSRAAFTRAVNGLTVRKTGPGLLDAIVDGYQSVRDDYQTDMFDQVLVLTDDQNHDSADPVALDNMVKRLNALQDPQKPVAVSVVVLGQTAAADRLKGALKPIAGAYVDNAASADDVQAAFIHVVAGGLHQ